MLTTQKQKLHFAIKVIHFSKLFLRQKESKEYYLLPSLPLKTSFLGLVLVGSICTVLETDSMVTICPAVPRPGIAITVLRRECSLGLIWSIYRNRLFLFWARCCRLTWIYNEYNIHTEYNMKEQCL